MMTRGAPGNDFFRILKNPKQKKAEEGVMAILKGDCDKEFSGHIEKTVVVRQYVGGRTVLSAFPDMSSIVPSESQKEHRMKFKEALAYAIAFLADPVNKAAYKALCGPGQKPHNVLMSELLKKEKPLPGSSPAGPVIVFGKTR